MDSGPRSDGDPSKSATGETKQRQLRVIVWCEVIFVLGLLGIWVASRQIRESPSLLVFFLYGLPCEFLVSVAPHEPAVLYVARFHDPLIVALIAGAGTLVAEAINYELLQHIGATPGLQRVSRARIVGPLVDAFGRAPFVALWIAGFVPVIPFMPFRVFVLLHRYPRGRYLAASVSSRTARFYVVALAGQVIRLPAPAIAILFFVLVLAVTLPGVYRVLAHANDTTLDEDTASPHTEGRALRAP